MWYFAWLLGLPLAAAFAVLNGMWFEITEDNHARHRLMTEIPTDSNPEDAVG